MLTKHSKYQTSSQNYEAMGQPIGWIHNAMNFSFSVVDVSK